MVGIFSIRDPLIPKVERKKRLTYFFLNWCEKWEEAQCSNIFGGLTLGNKTCSISNFS